MTITNFDSRTIKSNGKLMLNDLLLNCKKGDIVGLVSGIGFEKTSFLGSAFGSLNVDSRFTKIGSSPLVRVFNSKENIAYLPQTRFFPNSVKVSRMVKIVCGRRSAARVAGNSFVEPLLDRKGYQLTDGEKRLLEIILLVHLNVHFILLEEPFSGIDPSYTDEVKRIIVEQSKAKCFLIAGDYGSMADILTKEIRISVGQTPSSVSSGMIKLWGNTIDLG